MRAGLVGLQDLALVHHDDVIGQRHRLVLVVRDEDGGGLQALVQLSQFHAHQLTEFGIERAQRLVHQEGLRLAHDGPAERDALPVPAREPADTRAEQVLDAQDRRRIRHAPVDLGALQAFVAQRELQVAAHARCG